MPESNDLTCIAGHYAGRKLQGIESIDGPWHYWREENPTTRYLLDPRVPR